MKKILTFIPLGIGISSALIYLINIIRFRIINNSSTMLEILGNLKIYLYISIIAFIVYFLVRIFYLLKERPIVVKEKKVEPVEVVKTEIKEVIVLGNKYCDNCGEKIFDTDAYCKTCGSYQKDKKSGTSSFMKTVIYVIKIVILMLILFFLVSMMFEFKEKQDPNFKSPFNFGITEKEN